MQYFLLLDKLIAAVSMLLNLLGTSEVVSNIVARRIEEKRDWTDAERETITNELKTNKLYAKTELDKPD